MGFRFSPAFANIYYTHINTGDFHTANFALMLFSLTIMRITVRNCQNFFSDALRDKPQVLQKISKPPQFGNAPDKRFLGESLGG